MKNLKEQVEYIAHYNARQAQINQVAFRIEDQLEDQIWKLIEIQIDHQIKERVEDQLIGSYIYRKLNEKYKIQIRTVGPQVKSRIWDNLCYLTSKNDIHLLWERIENQIEDIVGVQIDEVWEQVWEQVWDQIE